MLHNIESIYVCIGLDKISMSFSAQAEPKQTGNRLGSILTAVQQFPCVSTVLEQISKCKRQTNQRPL